MMLKTLKRCALALSLVVAAGCAARVPSTTGTAAVAGGSGLGPISTAELRSHLFTLAHDSMQGRRAGTPRHDVATAYIAAAFERAGARPAGTQGSYFQTVPTLRRMVDPASSLSVGGRALALGREVVVLDVSTASRSVSGPGALYGGSAADSSTWLARDAASGRVVVLDGTGLSLRAALQPARTPEARYRGAAAILISGMEELLEEEAGRPAEALDLASAGGSSSVPVIALVTRAAAEALLGGGMDRARPGTVGPALAGRIGWVEQPAPTRNVIAVVPGRDPALRGEYVVVSAHNDHEGVTRRGVDHDSVRAYNRVMRPQGANDPVGRPTPAQLARIRALTDSLRRARGGVLRDSIYNGADDDASGTVVLLEVARVLAASPPRRSVLFVSHTAEEAGLLGSRHFTDNPTVPRGSMVAAINMDMVGRGRAEDIAGGGPHYLQIIGSRRLSTQLGNLIDALNARRAEPMRIDYSFDAAGHPLNRYCRSDHFMYARYGIPIAYLSRGYHVDYHMVTDDPQYIDFDGLTRVAGFVRDVAAAVGNLDQRPVVDGPRPDPNAPCRQ